MKFDDVAVKESVVQRVDIRNEGVSTAFLRLETLPRGFELEPEEFALGPREAEDLVIRFRPTEAREYDGLIELRSRLLFRIPVRGRGVKQRSYSM